MARIKMSLFTASLLVATCFFGISPVAGLRPVYGNGDGNTETNRKKLLDTGECTHCDLQGVDLSGIILEGVDLSDAHLQ
ncbi:MAG: pentapeptide repeat-containing protein, partial [Candidatus Bathyanammoxibius sp.]